MTRPIILLICLLTLAVAASADHPVRFLVPGSEAPSGVRVLDHRGDLWLVEGPADLVDRVPGATILPQPAPPRTETHTWSPLTEADPAIQALADLVVWPDLLADLQWLVGLGNRYSYNSNLHVVADSLEQRLEALGLATKQHDFDLNGTTVPNVIATQLGTVYPDSIFVICGHFDATSEAPQVATPGADDNASGSVAVLTAARLLADRSLDCTVQYVLFGGEEQGLRGSRAWVAEQATADVNIAGALNFDMIGWWEEGVQFDLEIETNAHSLWIAEAVVDCAVTYANMPYVLHEAENIWWGDFYAFWEQGYAAVNHEESWDWGDPDFNPRYHTTGDLVEYLDPDFTTGNVRVAVTALATLAGLAGPTAVEVAPVAMADLTAYPNPFNGRTTLVLSAPGLDGMLNLGIFDLTGRRVGTVDLTLVGGRGEGVWSAIDAHGAPLPTGVYLARAVGDATVPTCRVAYVK